MWVLLAKAKVHAKEQSREFLNECELNLNVRTSDYFDYLRSEIFNLKKAIHLDDFILEIL